MIESLVSRNLQKSIVLGIVCSLSFNSVIGQVDLDSLDQWVRSMHPAPFIRCGEQAWERQLEETRQNWPGASELERLRLVNTLLMVLQDSHTSIAASEWVVNVEKTYGTLPIRWAIEGRGLWVMDSGLPGLPNEVRVLSLNGIDAESVIEASLDLACMEGPSWTAKSRFAAHNVTSWAISASASDVLQIEWIDPESGLTQTGAFSASPIRQARRTWKPIWRPHQPVEWIFPDGSHLTRRDDRRESAIQERFQNGGFGQPRITTSWNGAATLKINTFGIIGWRHFSKRLYQGFNALESYDCPLIIDLRGNPGGAVDNIELLWNYIALEQAHLPQAMVFKQSDATQKKIRKIYRGLRKRWIDEHVDSDPDALYMHTYAHLPLGKTDTLFYPKHEVIEAPFERPIALLIDGKSASASVSFAGVFQATKRGTIIGESCLGPPQGTMGNLEWKTLPQSGIPIAISTAIIIAIETPNWATTMPLQPDVLVPEPWRRDGLLDQEIESWIEQHSDYP